MPERGKEDKMRGGGYSGEGKEDKMWGGSLRKN